MKPNSEVESNHTLFLIASVFKFAFVEFKTSLTNWLPIIRSNSINSLLLRSQSIHTLDFYYANTPCRRPS